MFNFPWGKSCFQKKKKKIKPKPKQTNKKSKQVSFPENQSFPTLILHIFCSEYMVIFYVRLPYFFTPCLTSDLSFGLGSLCFSGHTGRLTTQILLCQGSGLHAPELHSAVSTPYVSITQNTVVISYQLGPSSVSPVFFIIVDSYILFFAIILIESWDKEKMKTYAEARWQVFYKLFSKLACVIPEQVGGVAPMMWSELQLRDPFFPCLLAHTWNPCSIQ